MTVSAGPEPVPEIFTQGPPAPGLPEYEGAIPVSLPAAGSSGVVLSGRCLLMGWGLKESTGNVASAINIRNGQDASGQIVVPISLTAGQSRSDWMAPRGVWCRTGLFVENVTGSTIGALWAVPWPAD